MKKTRLLAKAAAKAHRVWVRMNPGLCSYGVPSVFGLPLSRHGHRPKTKRAKILRAYVAAAKWPWIAIHVYLKEGYPDSSTSIPIYLTRPPGAAASL